MPTCPRPYSPVPICLMPTSPVPIFQVLTSPVPTFPTPTSPVQPGRMGKNAWRAPLGSARRILRDRNKSQQVAAAHEAVLEWEWGSDGASFYVTDLRPKRRSCLQSGAASHGGKILGVTNVF